MKLDKSTLEVFSNFAQLNQGLVIQAGNVVMTKHGRNSSPIARVEFASVQFPRDFAIYDLSRFLSILNLFTDPEIEISDKDISISDQNRRSAKLRTSPKEVISHPEYKLPKFDKNVEFDLTTQDIKALQKAVGTLATPEFAFIGNGSKILLSTYDSNTPSADHISIEIGQTEDEFTIIMDAEHLAMMQRDYRVAISYRGLIEFRSETEHNTLYYWITAKEKSKIGK